MPPTATELGHAWSLKLMRPRADIDGEFVAALAQTLFRGLPAHVRSSGLGVAPLTTPPTPSAHEQLVRRNEPAPKPEDSEQELDGLITRLQERQRGTGSHAVTPDPIEALREMMLKEFIPVFVELVDKYNAADIAMQMDASNFLQGGREITFEFGVGQYRVQLIGTVTSVAIAFQETRYTPDIRGELLSGPMLSLRQLNCDTFRAFVCGRLTALLKTAMRRG